ncbi:hypothetical protein P280DRAFT_221817 [Massarina eburnea CBS 473.64]|uniref:Uncharacterized protein n=1 Tax=Massarina eburnea CBS 473.64 TaxID=1395130 RepID=A0A6A6S878_9PLEO|nr:hypothetical protein P280DRAFT_221817 [Massarina eburnea CBS 473.64]
MVCNVEVEISYISIYSSTSTHTHTHRHTETHTRYEQNNTAPHIHTPHQASKKTRKKKIYKEKARRKNNNSQKEQGNKTPQNKQIDDKNDQNLNLGVSIPTLTAHHGANDLKNRIENLPPSEKKDAPARDGEDEVWGRKEGGSAGN